MSQANFCDKPQKSLEVWEDLTIQVPHNYSNSFGHRAYRAWKP